MAAAVQEPKAAEYAPDELRMPFVHRDPLRFLHSSKQCEDFFSLGFAHRLKIVRDRSVPTIGRFIEAWNSKLLEEIIVDELSTGSPDTESTHNLKGNASLRPFVVGDYRDTQDPNGTGTGLAIACDNGGPYYVVNDHTLNRNDWFCAPLNGCSCPKSWLMASTFGRAAFDDLKHIAGLAAAAAFTTERMKIGLPLSLGGISHSPTARVIEAANPGGAEVVLVLDSGASMHAVGEATIMQDIQPFNFDMTVTLPDNSSLRIIGIGTVEVNGFHIPNVYLVEGLRKNLISVSQLDRDHGTCCCFHGGQCTVMIPGGDVVGGAILEDDGEYFGLYVLRFLEVPQPEE